jgi:hypothetical protein
MLAYQRDCYAAHKEEIRSGRKAYRNRHAKKLAHVSADLKIG